MTWAPPKKPVALLRRLAELVGGRMRRSNRGVPHVIVGGPDGLGVSIAYFKYPRPGHEHDHKPWAVFWPWPSYGRDQERTHVPDVPGVLKELDRRGILDLDDHRVWAGWEDFE